MSLRYLLDAYNIIYQIPSLATGSLEEQRKKLIRLIDSKRPQGSRNNAVTIVFDGRVGPYGRDEALSAKIIYSLDETADEKILRLIDESVQRKNIIVVSDDRPLQYAVRALGARSLSVREFVGRTQPKLLPKRPSKGRVRPKDSPKNIPHAMEHDITAEMESIWLKGKREGKP